MSPVSAVDDETRDGDDPAADAEREVGIDVGTAPEPGRGDETDGTIPERDEADERVASDRRVNSTLR